MLSATMLSLTRSIALRVPFTFLRSATPAIVQRSSLAGGVSPYRAFTNTPYAYAAAVATTKRKPVATKSKAKPKTKPKPKVKAKPKAKVKAKPKAKAKAKPKKKPAVKKPASTFVPLVLRPPKRPMGAFFIFLDRTLGAATPGTAASNVMDHSKAAATAWSNLTDAEKKPFLDEFRVLYDQYRRDQEKWIKDPKNVQILKTLNKDRKKRGKSRIHLAPSDRVKRPLSSYIRFFTELSKRPEMSREKAPPGVSYGSWLAAEAGTRWRSLPAVEKEKFVKDAAVARERYKDMRA